MTYLPCPLRRRSIGPLPSCFPSFSLEVGKSLLVDSDRPVEWSGVDLLLPSGIDGRTDGRTAGCGTRSKKEIAKNKDGDYPAEISTIEYSRNELR